jgi:putative redox protein
MTREEENMERNGLDLDVLQDAIDMIREQPEAGMVTIRTLHRWDDGFGVDGYAKEVEEGGEVTTRRFTFRTDWPPEIGGQNSGPSPGEALLGALGGCVAMTYVTKAASRGVPIDELEVAIQARVDLQGTFELDSVRAGLSDVTITVGVRSDVDDAVLDELARVTRRTSAVYDSLANPLNMQLLMERLPGNAASPQDEAAVVTDI